MKEPEVQEGLLIIDFLGVKPKMTLQIKINILFDSCLNR